MTTFDNITWYISTLLKVFMLLATGIAVWYGQWFNAFLALVAFGLSWTPAIFEKNLKVSLPGEIELILDFFIFASIYLGSMRGYYTSYWWWDILLHSSSGFVAGLIGFLLIYILNEEARVKMNLGPAFIFIFTFCFAITIGVLWEIWEFGMDLAFDLGLQHNSLHDTMWDLTVDTLGALLAGLAGAFYVKKVPIPLFERMVKRFLSKNRLIFNRIMKTKIHK